MLQENLRGEMKVAMQRDSTFLRDLSLVAKLADTMQLSSSEVQRMSSGFHDSQMFVWSVGSCCLPKSFFNTEAFVLWHTSNVCQC